MGIIMSFLLLVWSADAEFKVASAYGEVIDHGEYLTYEWHVQVAEDSTEPMYAIHFTTESLHQLGYYNFQNSKGWNVAEVIHEYTGSHLTVWYECNKSNRIQPGESIVCSADINKRFISDEIGPGIISGRYVPLAVLSSSTNGMPKAWASQFGLVADGSRMEVFNVAEMGDPDRDGKSNLEEYIEGTDPTNATSRLKFAFSLSETGMVICPNPPPLPGREYFVQKMMGDGSWGESWTFQYPDMGWPDPANETHGIYRISVGLKE